MSLASCLLGRPSSSSFRLNSRLSSSLRSLSLQPPKQPLSTPFTSRSFLPVSSSPLSPSIHQRRWAATTRSKKEPVSISIPDMEVGVELSEEQQAVLKLVEGGESVFFTGSAGTGKSLLLKHIIKALRYPSDPPVIRRFVAVTASTGAAAVNIGGQTLHSWAGIGLGKEEPEQYFEKWDSYKTCKALENWRKTDVLVIDEISMIDGHLFDKLERLGRLTRNSSLPFGGMQVVCSGDFLQLPPVAPKGTVPKFAFEADGWTSTMRTEVDLFEVFRQADPAFVKLLDQMRHGQLDADSIATLKGLERDITYEDGIQPVELYPVNSQADASNMAQLRALPKHEPLHEFYSLNFAGSKQDREPRLSDSVVQRGLAASPASSVLQLKVGAVVMLIQNDPDHVFSGLVNGSVGRIISFHSPTRIKEGKDSIPFSALRHGWRSLYVMQTEIQKAKGLEREEMAYPLVEFIAKGEKVLRLIGPSNFDVTASDGKILATRIQIPLILAWAISIHKSQGKTLERVKVDFRKVFEKGQAYVAASRCRRLETLQIKNFSASVVNAHPSVVKWHEARKAKGSSP